MLPTIVAILIVTGVSLYVVGIFVYDHRRKKKGMPSVFVDVCESEGHGQRLVKDYHKLYGKKK